MKIVKHTSQVLFVLILFSQYLFSQIQNREVPIDSFDIDTRFYTSGFMASDTSLFSNIELLKACRDNPHSAPFCFKISIRGLPLRSWVGLYWQNEPDNWGDTIGTDFSRANYKYLTFWARGETGYEMIEFGTGGINEEGKPYRDSYRVSIGEVVLTQEWRKYRIDLEGENLSSVIGGFYWSASKNSNPEDFVFYLDDILFVSDDL